MLYCGQMLTDLTRLYFKPSRCDPAQILNANRHSIKSLGLSQTKCPCSAHLDLMMSFEVTCLDQFFGARYRDYRKLSLALVQMALGNTMTNNTKLSYFACCCLDLMKHIEVSHGFHLKTLKSPLK